MSDANKIVSEVWVVMRPVQTSTYGSMFHEIDSIYAEREAAWNHAEGKGYTVRKWALKSSVQGKE